MNTILILHGWGSSSKNWALVRELLEKEEIKVYVPDLPGFGENPPPEKPWSVDDYVEWVKDFCEKQSLSQFFLLGQSFGGGLAVKLVNSFPGEIRGLILVAAKIKRQKTFRYYLGLILAKLGGMVFFTPFLVFLRPLGRKILYLLIGTRDYYQLEIKNAIIMKETFKEVVKADLTPFLSEIKIPTLIIWGNKDKITPLKDAYLINREIKDSKLEIIKNGRHGLNLEKPEILVEKIIKFIGN